VAEHRAALADLTDLASRIAAGIDAAVADAGTALAVHGEPGDSVIGDLHRQVLRAAFIDRRRLACARTALTRRTGDMPAGYELGRLAQAYRVTLR
jgi:hypothetical protein